MRSGSLTREITLALTFKLLALWVLWMLFFSPAHRPVIDNPQLQSHLFSSGPAQGQGSHPSSAEDQRNGT